MLTNRLYFAFFFFNDTATTEIYTLSLHDALPISTTLIAGRLCLHQLVAKATRIAESIKGQPADRKSTRLNSSHSQISYAVFCLKKKRAGNSIRIRSRLSSHTLLQYSAP